MFDWDYFTNFDDSTIILKELTKRDLALLSSAMSWFEVESEWETGTWDTIAAKLSEVQERISHDGYVCPEGDDPDYTLHDDITLVSDATTYTLEDLELLPGRDLRIELLIAGTSTSNRDLRVRINGLTTDIYNFQEVRHSLSTGYTRNTDTFFKMTTAVYKTETPQNFYSGIFIDIPAWKDDDRYPLLMVRGVTDTLTTLSKCHVQDITDLQSMSFFLSTGDIKTGSKIAVYSRG